MNHNTIMFLKRELYLKCSSVSYHKPRVAKSDLIVCVLANDHKQLPIPLILLCSFDKSFDSCGSTLRSYRCHWLSPPSSYEDYLHSNFL